MGYQGNSRGAHIFAGIFGFERLPACIEDKRVEIRTPILRHYQAARQLDLVLFTDSDVCTQRPVPEELLDDLCFEKIIETTDRKSVV